MAHVFSTVTDVPLSLNVESNNGVTSENVNVKEIDIGPPSIYGPLYSG